MPRPVGLALALLLSGCLGAGGPGGAPASSSAPGLGPGVVNVLEGFVFSEDRSPLEGAVVAVSGWARNATTDPSGRYRFQNLEARDHWLTASRQGYRAASVRAIVTDGEVVVLNFTLEAVPVRLPHNESRSFSGMLSCQASYATDPEEVQTLECGERDPANKPSGIFDLGPNASEVVVEAFWAARTALSQRLMMRVEGLGLPEQDLLLGQRAGGSGVKIVVPEAVLKRFFAGGGRIGVSMMTAPSLLGDDYPADVGASVQQSFEVFCTVFYLAPGPAGYSVRAAA